jgi:hypothetical protein
MNVKTAVKKIEEVSNVPALPDYLASLPQTGAGVSTKSEDNLIPMARILQKNFSRSREAWSELRGRG